MRKLLNTLYVITPESYLALDGESLVIRLEDKEVLHLPLLNFEGIVTFGYMGASPALMGACAKQNIPITFMTTHGRFLARVTGELKGNVLLRKQQYRISDNENLSLEAAKNMIIGKLYNSRWVIERVKRDHPMRIDTDKFQTASKLIKKSLDSISECKSLETLRGIEGEAAIRYFGVFDDLIMQQKEDFVFSGRNRRPPLDRVNALLSFVYTLLAHETAAALETVGLDPYVGFLHRDRPGRISLALDVMEELRPVMADRFVLSLINKREIAKKGFSIQENGAVIMDDDTRNAVLKAWQTRKKEIITHPFLEEKIEWGLIPYVQAMLLARNIRGDLDAYPAFLWK